ncbi:chitinase, partial [Plakobranchus ocellatus]
GNSGSSCQRRVCYHTNWSQYRPGDGKFMPEDIDPNLCTHLIYSFAKLTNDHLAAFEWNDEDTAWSTGLYTKFNNLKNQNPELKTMLAVGGWNMGSAPFSHMVSTQATRQELRDAFDVEAAQTGKDRLLLSAAVAAGVETIDAGYEITDIVAKLDMLNIMTYDMHGSWDPYTAHNSPLYGHAGETGDDLSLNVDYALNYWVNRGATKDKINVGLPTYGRTFTLSDPNNNGVGATAPRAGTAGKYTREAGFLAYYEICEMIAQGATVNRIDDQKVPYLVKGNQWVGYDDPESIRTKVQYINDQGYGGFMVWALDLDDFKGKTCNEGPYPLINAAKDVCQSGASSGSSSSGPGTSMAPGSTAAPTQNPGQTTSGQQTTSSNNGGASQTTSSGGAPGIS